MTPLTRALVAGLATASALALRVWERGEALSDRTFWLVVLGALGALLAAGLTGWLVARLPIAAGRHPLARRLAEAGLFAGLLIGAFGLLFVLHNRFIAGAYETHPDFPVRHLIFSSIHTFALFVYSCPSYLLPWPLPALMLGMGLLPPVRAGEPAGVEAPRPSV